MEATNMKEIECLLALMGYSKMLDFDRDVVCDKYHARVLTINENKKGYYFQSYQAFMWGTDKLHYYFDKLDLDPLKGSRRTMYDDREEWKLDIMRDLLGEEVKGKIYSFSDHELNIKIKRINYTR